MKRTKKPLPILENIVVSDVAAEGKAIAKNNDMVIFIPYVAPGDIIDVQLTRKKNSYAEGKAINIHTYSEERVNPICEHFGVCGGCKWQHLNYPSQLKYKQQQVTDNLTRIGKIELPETSPILGSAQTTHYRNKLEFTFSNKRWMTEEEIKSGTQFDDMNALGFHIPTLFDKVLDIKKCWLQDDISNQIRLAVRDYATANNLPFFDLRNRDGFLRNMDLMDDNKDQLPENEAGQTESITLQETANVIVEQEQDNSTKANNFLDSYATLSQTELIEKLKEIMSWLIYRLTGSIILLATVAFLTQIPSLFVSPLMGVVNDRFDRKKILILTQALSMVQALLMAVLVLTNTIQVYHIIILSIFLGLINSLDAPVRQAFYTKLVPTKVLGNAIALNSATFNCTKLIGPTIGGILIAIVGEGICFLINGVSFIGVIFALKQIKISKTLQPRTNGNIWNELKEGFTYSIGFLPIRSILIFIVVLAILSFPFPMMLPAFVKSELHAWFCIERKHRPELFFVYQSLRICR